MKKALFIDRDGTLVIEPPVDYQLDSLEKLEFYPGVFGGLGRIARELDYELVMVTNQDGLGTEVFPEGTFWPAQNKIIQAMANEGIHFSAIHIDPSFPEEGSPNRKPEIGMLKAYTTGTYDLTSSFVIGDRETDMILATNLGAKGIRMGKQGGTKEPSTVLETTSWDKIYTYLAYDLRQAEVKRKTNETDVYISLNLDGMGRSEISTGVAFFDHMLTQIARHAMVDLTVCVKGDLEVDEHHTIEDTALALGEAFSEAIGTKVGLERYGFTLPMDDCLAQVAIDFGGRSWLVWNAEFKREMIGQMPSEMFMHFFKSFTDTARCNLHITALGTNEHHKIEAIFKGLGKVLKQACSRNINQMVLPSTKGKL